MKPGDSAPETSGAEQPDFDLAAALLRGTTRVARRRALGVFLAGLGLATALLVLTVGSVAAAWDTPYRWHVLLGVVGLYLVIGSWGLWLLLQPIDDPDLRASQQKIAELRAHIHRWVDRLSLGDGPDQLGLGNFHPRSRTMQWVASLGSLPIPWTRIVQSFLLWRGIRRRRRGR